MSLDRAYIKSVNLKGYKTIKDLSATFNPGLNIIIGKNGGGKTNFMTFLNNVLTSDLNTLIDTYFNLELDGTVKVKLSADRTLVTKQNVNQRNADLINVINSTNGTYTIESSRENIMHSSWEDVQKDFIGTIGLVSPIFIPHGLRQTNLVLNDTLSFTFSTNPVRKLSLELFNTYVNKTDHSFFARVVAFSLLVFIVNNEMLNDNSDESLMLEIFKKHLDLLLSDINNDLSTYLPIDEIRLSPNLKLSREGNADSITISNMSFEYRVNANWLQFSSLSDGTKRLLIMFLDIFCIKLPEFNYGFTNNRVVLLEEPELGIHPHLLTNFLKFIKEYSQYMQIIITTHAPLSLNIIGKDDLDIINICKYDPVHGTTLTKLTDEQKKQAKLYMEDMYLSDYWQYSTLED